MVRRPRRLRPRRQSPRKSPRRPPRASRRRMMDARSCESARFVPAATRRRDAGTRRRLLCTGVCMMHMRGAYSASIPCTYIYILFVAMTELRAISTIRSNHAAAHAYVQPQWPSPPGTRGCSLAPGALPARGENNSCKRTTHGGESGGDAALLAIVQS